MKRSYLFSIVGILIFVEILHAARVGNIIFDNAPASVAATTTNTLSLTATSGIDLTQVLASGSPDVRLAYTCNGLTAASTNGNIVATFVTSQDGGKTWDSVSNSGIILTVAASGTAIVSASDWFHLSGVKRIALGQVINGSAGIITNSVATLNNNP